MDIKTNDGTFCPQQDNEKGEVCEQQPNVHNVLTTKTSNISLSVQTQQQEQCGQQVWPNWKNGSKNNAQIPTYNTK